MKPRLHLSVAFLLICNILGAQTYRYTFSHDTVGNRTSRVYQGVVQAKGSGIVKEYKEIDDVTDN